MCESCAENLSRISGKICTLCGREKAECSCRGEKYFDSIVAPFYFEGVVRKGIHQFKFRKWYQHAEAYAIEMADTLNKRMGDKTFDFIVSVPMTKKSQRKRGYNHGALLAKALSEKIGIVYLGNLMIKIYETEDQHTTDYSNRRGNLAGVFDVTDPEFIKGKRILICDDISTTGETLNECAKMLWLYGAEEICCVCIALTKYKKKKK